MAKEPHYHLDQDKRGKFFAWQGVQATEKMFVSLVYQKFGYPIKEIYD